MPNKFWSFKAAGPKSGDLMLYGIISSESWFGDEVTPMQFKSELDALGDIDTLNVYLNSDGGDVFAGQAIHSMLKRHKAQVVVTIDGLAASIASVIAMAGDVVIMPRNAMLMIHNPWTIAMGDSAEFRKTADTLDQVRESLVAAYEGKTGLERDTIIAMLDAETWLTAEEAVKQGFADRIEDGKAVAASMSGAGLIINGLSMDLSRFRHPPKLAFLPPPVEPVAPDMSMLRRRIDLAARI